MPLYASVDLHSNNSYATITDGKDKVIKEKRLPNQIEEVERFFGPYKDRIDSVVTEATYNGYWLLDGLKGLGYNVKLANPSAMKQYEGLKHTDDKSDCLWLNRLNRLNILPQAYIYPEKDRPVRDLLRRRMYLTQMRTSFITVLKIQFQSWNSTSIAPRAIYKLDHADISKLFRDKALRLSANSFLDSIQLLNQQITEIESHVERAAKKDPVVDRLQVLKGIGPILAWTIKYETGELSRFKSIKNYLSYAGLVESLKLSNFKVKGKGNRKNRNRFLRWAFQEAAIHSLLHNRAERYHDRLARRKGKFKAKAIMASKIARVAYMIMEDPNFIYDPDKLFR